jgi:hypothetical protein
MKVYIFRLNGVYDEIIAKCDYPYTSAIKIIDPLTVYTTTSGGMALKDTLVLAKDKCLTFKEENVIYCYEASENMTQYYNTFLTYNDAGYQTAQNEILECSKILEANLKSTFANLGNNTLQ